MTHYTFFHRDTFLSLVHLIKQNLRSLATKTPNASNNQRRNNMNLTKSVRGLATDINAAPQYDSNDDVSESSIVSSVFII
jgi:hypothetical protein